MVAQPRTRHARTESAHSLCHYWRRSAERTFFRYFADKREVLFTDQSTYQAMFLDALNLSTGLTPLDQVADALRGGAAFFPDERRVHSRRRQRIIDSSLSLQERESVKRQGLVEALTAGLVERGVQPVPAALAAQIGGAAFHQAFAAWITDGQETGFAALLEQSLAELRRLLA